MGRAEAAVKELEEGRVKLSVAPGDVARQLLQRLGSASATLALVQLANSYWTKADYSSVSYSDERKKAFASNYNTPRAAKKLKQEIESFDISVKIDGEILKELQMKYEEAQRKKTEEELNQRKIR